MKRLYKGSRASTFNFWRGLLIGWAMPTLLPLLFKGRFKMAYSQFNLSKVKEYFHLTTLENTRFLPTNIESIEPSPRLMGILEELPWAIAVDT